MNQISTYKQERCDLNAQDPYLFFSIILIDISKRHLQKYFFQKAYKYTTIK